jgi:glutamyl-tRNA reductase
MNLFAVGLNNTTAPVSLREQVAFAPDQVAHAVADARAWFTREAGGPSEAALLSTCNRTELYVAMPRSGSIEAQGEAAARFIAHYHRMPYADLRPHLYVRSGEHAVRHAFRVASGLDSMVLGEPQILGQMKEAARQAGGADGLGTYLHQMFQRTFSVAKEVRSSTAIGAHSISMAAAAVRLAQGIFPSLAGLDVLFIGAGEMIELCAAHFAAQQPDSITVANRTLQRAELLARRYNGHAIGLTEAADSLAAFDIVISCTGSALPIVGLGAMERALRPRRGRPMFLVDLAVPRDIESEVAGLPDVFLYNVDDLAGVVQSGREQRQAAVAQAEAIIETGVSAFMDWADWRAVVPMIRDLHAAGEDLRLEELQRARKMLARGDDAEAVLAALSRGLTAKFLHGPQQVLRNTQGAERERMMTLLPQLFCAGV